MRNDRLVSGTVEAKARDLGLTRARRRESREAHITTMHNQLDEIRETLERYAARAAEEGSASTAENLNWAAGMIAEAMRGTELEKC